jgi:hypothetical protein
METQRIPVISLYGPWANWVALGWKTIETRTHPRLKSLVGKTIGIHVALKWDDDALEAAAPFLSQFQISRTQQFLRVGGGIICTAFAYDHRELDSLDNGSSLIDCTHLTRYGLFLRDIRPIEVIPAKGKQGIWYADIPAQVIGS